MGSRGTLFLVGALVSYAPYQCGHPPDPALREETPGEALYGVAQKLRAEGNLRGYQTTLQYLIGRYPKSRYAVAARADLEVDAALDPP